MTYKDLAQNIAGALIDFAEKLDSENSRTRDTLEGLEDHLNQEKQKNNKLKRAIITLLQEDMTDGV